MFFDSDRIKCRMFCVSIVAVLVLCITASPAQSEVVLEIVSNQNHASTDSLEPFDVLFIVHANGHNIAAASFPLDINFTNGNIIGTIGESPLADAQLLYSDATMETFESISVNTSFGQGNDPDTLLLGMIDFGGPIWTGSGEMWRIHVTPKDTGSFVIAGLPNGIPPVSHLNFVNENASGIPLTVLNHTIHVPPQPEAVRYRVAYSSGTSPPIVGNPLTIEFQVDASGHEIQAMGMGHQWLFSNGNIVGPHSIETGEVVVSAATTAVFESISYRPAIGSSPDTSHFGAIDFGGGGYTGDGTVWSLTITPTDTGLITVDTTYLPPGCCGLGFIGPGAQNLPVDYIVESIPVVPCPYELMGDVNQDSAVSSADLVYLVNYIFKSGPDPLPERSIADVNCSGGLGGADIIFMVNFIFKSGPAPCDCIVRRI